MNNRPGLVSEAAMSLRFRCVECGASVNLPDSRLDKKNYCPRCDARLPNRPGRGGGGVGLVIALVLGAGLLGVLGIAGVGALFWFLGRDVAPQPPMVAQAGGPVAPDNPEPVPPIENPPIVDPEPAPRLPDIRLEKRKGARVPPPDFPDIRPDPRVGPPPVKELKLPALP